MKKAIIVTFILAAMSVGSFVLIAPVLNMSDVGYHDQSQVGFKIVISIILAAAGILFANVLKSHISYNSWGK